MSEIMLHHLRVDAGELPVFTDRIETMNEFIQTREPDRHSFHELVWIERGEGWHNIDFERHDIRPDTFFYIAPGQIHFWQVPQRSIGHVLLYSDELFLTGGLQSGVARVRGRIPAAYHAADERATQLKTLFQQINIEYTTRDTDWQMAVRSLLQMLLIQARRFQSSSSADASPTAGSLLTHRFHTLVEQGFSQAHSVQPYARALAVSAGHLSDVVRETTGFPAGAVIRHRIVLEAKRLLVHTDETAETIGLRLGFKTASYFGRFFHRETKATPDGFRRAFRKKYQLPLS